MCFIPVGSQRLHDIPDCVGGALFFTDELNVPSRRFDQGFPGVSERTEWFTITYRGAFRVKRGGIYQFRLKSDDGSMLFIDHELVVDHDGVHDATSKRGEVDLDEGGHQLAVRYFQGPRYNIALQLFVTPPGEAERLFNPEL
jgi:fibro-slime domain-containing protein